MYFFCLKNCVGHHTAKIVQHPSGLYCSEISTCLGVLVFPTAASLFGFATAARLLSWKMLTILLRWKRYFASNYFYHLKNYLIVCLKKVDQEQQLTIKRNSDQLAISVESECKRPSASCLSGGGGGGGGQKRAWALQIKIWNTQMCLEAPKTQTPRRDKEL